MTATPVRFCDKLLPDQKEHTYHFRDGDDYVAALYDTICRSSGILSPDQEFKLEKTDRFTVEEMASNPVSLRFLQFLIQVSGVKRVLEIGAFIGVSAMYFAKALPPGGQVVTIEKFDHFAAIARRNFAANGLADRITLLEGDAFEVIEGLPKDQKFDLIFIDGNKERYKDYFVKTEPLLSPRGIALVDDCFFHGDAVNATPSNEKGAGTRAFLDYAATRTDYRRVALPLANGIMMMVRNGGA
jgi:caffeoyl-CoA O-methyltransferase